MSTNLAFKKWYSPFAYYSDYSISVTEQVMKSVYSWKKSRNEFLFNSANLMKSMQKLNDFHHT